MGRRQNIETLNEEYNLEEQKKKDNKIVKALQTKYFLKEKINENSNKYSQLHDPSLH